jgi:hypothetical protein
MRQDVPSSIRSCVPWGHGGRCPHGFCRRVGQCCQPLRAARHQQHMHLIEHMGTAHRPIAHTLEVDTGRDSMPSRTTPIRYSLLVSEVALPHITTLGRDGPEAMDCGNAVVVNVYIGRVVHRRPLLCGLVVLCHDSVHHRQCHVARQVHGEHHGHA